MDDGVPSPARCYGPGKMGGQSAIDTASYAFLKVVEIPGYYHGSYRLCFAQVTYDSWIREGEPDRPRIQITISAANSATIARDFILVIDSARCEPENRRKRSLES
jgi:hypothetical protein